MVLGQVDTESGLANEGVGTRPTGLSQPSAVALTPAGGMLIADPANNRVVFHGAVPAASGAAASAALGQPDLFSASSSLAGLTSPFGVAVGAGRMAVADSAAHRVLVYASVPIAGTPMPAPVAVIGQPDMGTSVPGCAPDRLNFPTAVVITPLGKLIVADTFNHRVLVWNTVPLATPAPAPDVVLGQSGAARCVRNNNDLNGDLPARGTLNIPVDVWSNDTRVVVADAGNHRVLVWRDFPGANLQDADVVLGHTSPTSAAPNDGQAAPTASTLRDPEGLASDGTALAVADALNNRVLVWRTFPDSDGQGAEVVLGHQDFGRGVSNDGNNDGAPDAPTAQVFNYPVRVLMTPESLFVSDMFHHRVLRFAR